MNIAVGRAASSLSALVNSAVELSVPEVHIIPFTRVRKKLNKIIGKSDGATIFQDFIGPLSGRIGLYMPIENARELLNILIGPHATSFDSFSIEEQSVLEEVANILLNGAISAIADLLDVIIQLSLPSVVFGTKAEGYSSWLAQDLKTEDSVFVIVVADMVVEEENLRGLIVLSMAVSQIADLIANLV